MTLRKTPLNAVHRALGARMVEFARWEMPVQYSGVVDEHLAVRSSCGVFDVSHMGEIEVRGPGALETVQRLTTNDASRMDVGRCQYTLLCLDGGGVLDDTVLYRLGGERFLFCVNASNTEKVLSWMVEHAGKGAEIRDRSEEFAQIALQGPRAADVLSRVADFDVETLKFYRFVTTVLFGSEAVVSRTGYTGEDGFEIYIEPRRARALWEALMEAGRSFSIKPVGLGARDTLRLEMGYPLYGHELDEETTPLEAGLERFVAFDKEDFMGRAALLARRGAGLKRRLVGFTMVGPGIPRRGYAVTRHGEEIGRVTSGTFSPSLKKPIGMAYIRNDGEEPCDSFHIVIRNREAAAVVTPPPFYRRK